MGRYIRIHQIVMPITARATTTCATALSALWSLPAPISKTAGRRCFSETGSFRPFSPLTQDSHLHPTTGVDNSRTGEGADRPNVLSDPYVRNLNTRVWLNAAAFAQNPVGTFGNAGWNSLRGPGFFDIDVGLSRSFAIREVPAVTDPVRILQLYQSRELQQSGEATSACQRSARF